MASIEESYGEFRDEVDIRAQSDGNFMHAAMFELFAEAAEGNGDVETLDYAHYKKQGLQIDGYHFDPDVGVLTIVVAEFRPERTLQTVGATEIRQLFKRAENFVQKAFDPKFSQDMEETTQGFQVAFLIHQNYKKLTRVRFLLFSNSRLSSRLSGLESRNAEGITFSYSILDFGRYFDIVESRTGHEPIEVDLVELSRSGLGCLPAHSGSASYEAYLVAMPGDLLAKIYAEYGARLLEQNVRTFLQARGKVNKGIIGTIKNDPEMFFAYNNGLTATASKINLQKAADGTPIITHIHNLQIVNGGQTTASMLYARDKEKASLDKVYVQMKLSVISPERIDEVVPNISRFANTQNKVSEADFFSNHPFHVRIEEFSRRLAAPPKEGQFTPGKWFYERARGQYKDAFAYASDAQRKRFQTEFPKSQVFTKTDLAKYEVTFYAEPHLVSQGAQKNFLRFAERIASLWESNDKQINEDYYRSVIARAIIFRHVDELVMKASWYQGGYKANIVTYSIAWLVHRIQEHEKKELDFDRVWREQSVPEPLHQAFITIAKKVAEKIEETPDTVRNVTEWCKRQACWKAVSELRIDLPGSIGSASIDRREAKQKARDAAETQEIDNSIRLQTEIVELRPLWPEIKVFAMKNRCIENPQVISAIDRAARGQVPSQRDIRLLGELLQRVKSAGMRLPDNRSR